MADFNEVLRLDPQFGEAYRERGHAWRSRANSTRPWPT